MNEKNYIETELSEDEIKAYEAKGYIVEEIESFKHGGPHDPPKTNLSEEPIYVSSPDDPRYIKYMKHKSLYKKLQNDRKDELAIRTKYTKDLYGRRIKEAKQYLEDNKDKSEDHQFIVDAREDIERYTEYLEEGENFDYAKDYNYTPNELKTSNTRKNQDGWNSDYMALNDNDQKIRSQILNLGIKSNWVPIGSDNAFRFPIIEAPTQEVIYDKEKATVLNTEKAFLKKKKLEEDLQNEKAVEVAYPDGSQLIQANVDPAFGTYGNYMLAPDGNKIPVGPTVEDYEKWKTNFGKFKKKEGVRVIPEVQFEHGGGSHNRDKNNTGADWGQTMYVKGDPNTNDPQYLKDLDSWANNIKSTLPNEYKNYSTTQIKDLYDKGKITNTDVIQGEIAPAYQLDEFEVTPQSSLPYWDQITDSQKELILRSNQPTDPEVIKKYGYDPNKNNPMLKSALAQANSGYGLINPETGKKNETFKESVVDNMVKPGMAVAAMPLAAQALPQAWTLANANLTGVGGTSIMDGLGYYGAYEGATALPEDVSNFVQNPSWSNAGSIGLDALGIAGGAWSGSNLIKGVKSKYIKPSSVKSDLPNSPNSSRVVTSKADDAVGTNNSSIEPNDGESMFYGNRAYNQNIRQNAERNSQLEALRNHENPIIRKRYAHVPNFRESDLLQNVDDHIVPLIENFNNPAAKEKLIGLGIKDPDDFIGYLLNEVQYTNIPGKGGYAGPAAGKIDDVDDLVNLGIGEHSETFNYVPDQISHTGDHEIGHLIQRYMGKRGLLKDGQKATDFDTKAAAFFRDLKKSDDVMSTKNVDSYAYTQKDYGPDRNLLLPEDRYNVKLDDLTRDLQGHQNNLELTKGLKYNKNNPFAKVKNVKFKEVIQRNFEESKNALEKFKKQNPDKNTFINNTTDQLEPLPMLRELRNELHQSGAIKNFQDPIDESTLMNFWKTDAGKQNRILSFLKPSTEGKSGIVDLINKTPVVAGAVGTAGVAAAANQQSQEEFSIGGEADELDLLFNKINTKSNNIYNEGGEFIDIELTPEEIKAYIAQGYSVKELE